jgi:hypothetical protein
VSAADPALTALNERMRTELPGPDDARRYSHATYLRTTEAVAAEIDRGGFTDNAWLSRWDIAFAQLYLDALAAAEVPGPWRIAFDAARDDTLTDRLLRPANRMATRRFLAEARRKVWHNTGVLDHARRAGPARYSATLAALENLCTARVRELTRPGPVLLTLARKGFGVVLPAR